MWLLVPILIYCIVYLYVRHVYTYWERKGFPSERSGLSWSFLKQVYKREFHYVNAVCEDYQISATAITTTTPATSTSTLKTRTNDMKSVPLEGNENRSCHPLNVFGIYFSFRPILLIRDLDVARSILENSYAHFNDGKWDYMRGYRKINLLEKLAPIFNAQCMDEMSANVEKVADYMIKYLKDGTLQGEMINSGYNVNIPALVRSFSINVMGNLIYGLDENNFENIDAKFYKYINDSRGNGSFNSYTLKRLPKKSSFIYRLRDILKENAEAREEGGCLRKDVLQLLVKYRNGNQMERRNNKLYWNVDNVFEREKVLSIKKLSKIAEALLYMGLDTIESVTILTLYEILKNSHILQKLQAEIDEMFKVKMEMQKQTSQVNANILKLSYTDLEKLSYLEACIQETMRLFPPVPIIERVCHKNFNIPATRFTINEGKTIMIPLIAMQRDEKYFKQPLLYKPERFIQCQVSNENMENLNGNGNTIGNDNASEAGSKHDKKQPKGQPTICYGFGINSCIAENFSKLIIKMALVKLLHNFKLNYELPTSPTTNGTSTLQTEHFDDKELEIVYTPTPCLKSREAFQVKFKNRLTKPTFYL